MVADTQMWLRRPFFGALLLALVAGCSGSSTSSSSDVDSPHTLGAQSVQGFVPEARGFSFGLGTNGQLGDGGKTDSDVPVEVGAVPGTTAMTAGGAHSLLLASRGAVWAWGWNRFGQLGDGTFSGPQQCTQFPCSTVPVKVEHLQAILSIAAGDEHSLAIATDGSVWAWGANANGELGTGRATTTGCMCSDVPVRSAVPSGIVAIAGGGRHSLALRNDGTVWAWGENSFGQLGDGTLTERDTPVEVPGLSSVTAISAGFEHSLALTNDGVVYAWGRNTFGQLGDGTTQQSEVPIAVTNLSNLIAVRGGGQFSLALRADGTVWTWGENNEGQLGDDSLTNSPVPVEVTGLENVVSVGVGHQHGLALDGSGTLWAWGENVAGELGNGTMNDSKIPVNVEPLTGIKTLGGGDRFSVVF
jgi:alpha-tubulin suppressor-like RCC1 family protein